MGRDAAQRQGQGRPGPFVIVRIRVGCEQERYVLSSRRRSNEADASG